MTTSTVVFVLLDAFRWDYINPDDTPLLHRLSESGVYARRLVSSSGFAQRTALFCGTSPDRTGNFTMFTFDPTGSPFRFLAPYAPALVLLQRLLDSGFPGNGRLGEALRRRYIEPRARTQAAYAPAAFIPLHVLPWIGVSEDERPIHTPGALPAESVFDVLTRSGITYSYLMFPEVNCEDDRTLTLTLDRIEERRKLYLLQFSDADSLCHIHGPDSPIRHRVAGEIDRKLRVLKRAFDQAFDDVTFLIVGDHGMMNVDETVDVGRIVHERARRNGLRHGRDYLLFLDSTLARLWALQSGGVGRLEVLFEDSALERTGTRVTAEAARERRIPWLDRRYGDLLWSAGPGVLIHPDYFHPPSQIVRGMHGYDSCHEKMQGFAVLYGDAVPAATLAQARLVDICPTLCDVLGIPFPAKNEGGSLLAAPLTMRREGGPS